MNHEQLKDFLNQAVEDYNRPGFIESDPIGIPHRFTKKQDIEIAGLFAASLAWGQRKTIISKCSLIMEMMDNDPFKFIVDHSDNDLKPLTSFVHRTFNSTDLLHFVAFLKTHYSQSESLETAFFSESVSTVQEALIQFHNYFFQSKDSPERTRKHVATPARKSACKRLNMYLRWMVRKDDKGVDFGIWKASPSLLHCPLDVHVQRVAHKLHILERTQADWKAAEELTSNLRSFDPDDPVKYDFALFGLGVDGRI